MIHKMLSVQKDSEKKVLSTNGNTGIEIFHVDDSTVPVARGNTVDASYHIETLVSILLLFPGTFECTN